MFYVNITVALIRHGKTQGNVEKRYVGRTDEPLCQTGADEISSFVDKNIYPKVQLIFSSPLKRCLKTSAIVYKNSDPIVYDDLIECDFGVFEGKNYEELKANKHYIAWIESNGKMAFPSGENSLVFKQRCQNAFDSIIEETLRHNAGHISIICHGGTIMSILEKYSCPNKDFYNWQAKNGNGFIFNFNSDKKKAMEIRFLYADD